MQRKSKVAKKGKTVQQPVFSLEEQVLKFGLNSEPTSANVVAKRLQMKETPKNVAMLKKLLDKLTLENKVYRCGSRYAIDYRGAKNLMETFCVKTSDNHYKVNDVVFYRFG